MIQRPTQRLVDLIFSIAGEVHSQEWLQRATNEEVMAWVARRLRDAGYDTKPSPNSWGILKTFNDRIEEAYRGAPRAPLKFPDDRVINIADEGTRRRFVGAMRSRIWALHEVAQSTNGRMAFDSDEALFLARALQPFFDMVAQGRVVEFLDREEDEEEYDVKKVFGGWFNRILKELASSKRVLAGRAYIQERRIGSRLADYILKALACIEMQPEGPILFADLPRFDEPASVTLSPRSVRDLRIEGYQARREFD